MADQTPATSCGYVTLLGAPNTGKSTLLNQLVGSKVSIVSPKVQTTRNRVLGIAIRDNAQIVFVDTPGLFKPKKRLERAMVQAAWAGARDADRIVMLVDATRPDDPNTARLIAELGDVRQPADCAINKIDQVKRERLLALAADLDGGGRFQRIFMISALNGDGVSDLADHLTAEMPSGRWLYPEDQVADMPLRLLAAEITREKLFLQLQQELPYAAAVETEAWQERDDGSVRIDQVVYVRRDSQKMIVLGKKGARIKAIGSAARTELSEILDRKVHLFLHVKVRANWQDDPERYRDLGLEFNV